MDTLLPRYRRPLCAPISEEPAGRHPRVSLTAPWRVPAPRPDAVTFPSTRSRRRPHCRLSIGPPGAVVAVPGVRGRRRAPPFTRSAPRYGVHQAWKVCIIVDILGALLILGGRYAEAEYYPTRAHGVRIAHSFRGCCPTPVHGARLAHCVQPNVGG